MSRKLALAVAVVITASLSPAIAQAAKADGPTPGPSQDTSSLAAPSLVLSREQQPKAARPTLNKLSEKARAQGISLKQELDNYADEIEKSDPGIQRSLPDGPVPDPVIKVDGIPFAELIDLHRLATTTGITFEEAIDRYAWAPTANAVAVQLTKELPDDVAGFSLVNDGRTLRMGFKAEIPTRAVELAKTLPGEVQLIQNRGFSEAELRELSISQRRAIATHPEVERVKGSYDTEAGAVLLEVQPKKGIRASDYDRLRAELQAAQPMNPHVTFKVTTVDDLGIKPKDNYLRGGGYFNLPNGTPWCTAGFNVISETGVKGTTTAKHCADDPYLIYLNHPAEDDNRTTVSRMYRAPDYDIARYQGGDLTYTRTFYYELNLPRYATNWSVPAVTNIPMCTFGRTSATQGLGARCGKVTQLSVGWDDGFEDNFETDTATLGGDSGGPAYWGGTAYGILYAGEEPPGSVLHSYHAKVWNIPKAGGFGTANPWQVWTCNTC